MDFIGISKKYSFWGNVLHIVLNIALVIAVFVSIISTKMPIIAIILVAASKWRTLAVRPRYWLVNLKSNMVDIIFCVSAVILMWLLNGFVLAQSVLLIVYLIWMIFLKYRSDYLSMRAQALLSVFVGIMALNYIFYATPILIVLGSFFIGYSSFRHVLSAKESENIEIYSLFWGMILAELSWIFTFWTIGYEVFSIKDFMIPQPAIILTVLSFASFEAIGVQQDKNKSAKDLIAPIVFSAVVCIFLVVFFSNIPK